MVCFFSHLTDKKYYHRIYACAIGTGLNTKDFVPYEKGTDFICPQVNS